MSEGFFRFIVLFSFVYNDINNRVFKLIFVLVGDINFLVGDFEVINVD